MSLNEPRFELTMASSCASASSYRRAMTRNWPSSERAIGGSDPGRVRDESHERFVVPAKFDSRCAR